MFAKTGKPPVFLSKCFRFGGVACVFSPIVQFCSTDSRCAFRAVNSMWHSITTIPGFMLPRIVSMMEIQQEQESVRKHMNLAFIIGDRTGDSNTRPAELMAILEIRGCWKQVEELKEMYPEIEVNEFVLLHGAIQYDNFEDVGKILKPSSHHSMFFEALRICCRLGKDEMLRLFTATMVLDELTPLLQQDVLQHVTTCCATIATLDYLCQAPYSLDLKSIPNTIIATWQYPVLRDLISMGFKLQPVQWSQVKLSIQHRWMMWLTTGHFACAWELLASVDLTGIVAIVQITSALIRMLLIRQQTLLLHRLLAPPFTVSADVSTDLRRIVLVAGQSARGLKVVQIIPGALEFLVNDGVTNAHLLQAAIMRLDKESFDVLCSPPYNSKHTVRRWTNSFLRWLERHATPQILLMVAAAMPWFPMKSHRRTGMSVFRCTQHKPELGEFVRNSRTVAPFMEVCVEMGQT